MKKITLQLSNGREMSFSEQELIAIVEKHLSSEDTKKATIAEVVKKPTEGEWFEVKPSTINQKLFEKKREDEMQENTRKLILEAFEEMKKDSKYEKNIKTMFPKQDWERKTPKELKKIACNIGDHNADWVEQALEWAQRISNGESWKSICNEKDTANCYRIVVWKDGYAHMIGGSAHLRERPATYVYYYRYYDPESIYTGVPLVVLYEK